MLKLNQLINALESAVKNDDEIEFSVVIERLHQYPEQQKVISKIDDLIERYSYFDWYDTIAETESQPQWILMHLPVRQIVKLQSGLLRQLQDYFQASSSSPKSLTEVEIESKIDRLVNQLISDFLLSQQQQNN